MTKKVCGFLLFGMCALSDSTFAQQYTVTDLGGGASAPLIPRAINSSGQIAGYTATFPHRRAWLWTDGAAQDLSLPGADCSAMGLDDAGQVVGACGQAFLWTPERGMTALDLPESAFPWAINNKGDVVGDFIVNGVEHAFLYRAGAFEDLGPSVAEAINDAGQVVGFQWIYSTTHALLWDDAGAHDLGSLSDLDSSTSSINSDGLIAGSSRDSELSSHAVVWTPYGIANLGGLCESGATDALGIDGWLVVGVSFCAGGGRAFIYDLNGPGYPVDLNDLIPADSGWVLTLAKSINAAGQIVGEGTLNGDAGHGFLLTPVDPAADRK